MGVECGFDSPEGVTGGIAAATAGFEGMDFPGIGHGGKRLTAQGGPRGFFSAKKKALPPPSDYPYTLVKGRLIFGSEDLSNRAPVMSGVIPPLFVELSEEDATAGGIEDGAEVSVRSRKGELRVSARVSKRIPPGVAFMPEGFGDGPANKLLAEDGHDFVRIEICRK
jgi:anaerobic selenocysteine-containing dehydrogenase